MVATRRSARVANATAAVSEKIGSVANASTSKAQKSPYSVFFFVPNLIGYSRIILAAISLYYMPIHPKVCVTLYCISCLLDAVDGTAARYFNQCSKFGAVLDMVTDRCTTTCLLCFLSNAYPSYTLIFQALISLDFSSHYIHMYSSLVDGASSHKNISQSSNPLLRAYYTNNVVLFIMCAGNELFFVALYLFAADGTWSFFGMDFRMIVALLTFPICAGKQIISVIQFIGASKVLARIDVAEMSSNGAVSK
ncbi:phosphatidylinositol synthase 1 (CDP-alcohol phosphatidyltransferase1) [Umbelopsis sp. WA50703]